MAGKQVPDRIGETVRFRALEAVVVV